MKINKYISTSCFTALSVTILIAQNVKIDSLKEKLKTDSLKIYKFKKIRPYLSLDNRNSFIKTGPINIKGLQIGTILNEKHIIGLGVYNITKQTAKPTLVKDKNTIVNQYLKLAYITHFYQYTIFNSRFFELDVPMEIGRGKYELTLKDSLTGKIISYSDGEMIPIGGGAQIILKPLKWIGFSANLGYRLVIEQNKKLNFNGAYYSLGIWVDVRQIIRDTRYYAFKKPRFKKELKKFKTT